MLYQCQACRHEVARGWLPTASCGLYLMLLLLVTCAGTYAGAWTLAWTVKQMLPERAAEAAAEPEPMAWWGWVLGSACSLPVVFVFFGVLNWLLETTEYLLVRREPCPQCGAKQWSRGFTRGFGL